jgi:ethanolamine utilization cobalamin adenosyltransferase
MKESVGKYNKKTMLPVHKIDNLSVALSFLNKKGVDIQFITPQGNIHTVDNINRHNGWK